MVFKIEGEFEHTESEFEYTEGELDEINIKDCERIVSMYDNLTKPKFN